MKKIPFLWTHFCYSRNEDDVYSQLHPLGTTSYKFDVKSMKIKFIIQSDVTSVPTFRWDGVPTFIKVCTKDVFIYTEVSCNICHNTLVQGI